MYIPKSFAQTDLDTLHALINQYNFATLVSVQDGLPVASHLPFLLQPEPGHYGTLQGHMARANPQWRSFAQNAEVLVIFQGPHAYISPAWYEAGLSVPTWNYAIVHAYGKVRLLEDFDSLQVMMGKLVGQHEGSFEQPWSFEALPNDYVQKMFSAIVAFEIEITRLEGKYKLSQNRSETDQNQVATVLEASPDPLGAEVAALMHQNLRQTAE